MTSLMLACSLENLEISRLLLQHGASKTAFDAVGRSAYALTPAANAALRNLVRP